MIRKREDGFAGRSGLKGAPGVVGFHLSAPDFAARCLGDRGPAHEYDAIDLHADAVRQLARKIGANVLGLRRSRLHADDDHYLLPSRGGIQV
jgi:hypothetical protein